MDKKPGTGTPAPTPSPCPGPGRVSRRTPSGSGPVNNFLGLGLGLGLPGGGGPEGKFGSATDSNITKIPPKYEYLFGRTPGSQNFVVLNCLYCKRTFKLQHAGKHVLECEQMPLKYKALVTPAPSPFFTGTGPGGGVQLVPFPGRPAPAPVFPKPPLPVATAAAVLRQSSTPKPPPVPPTLIKEPTPSPAPTLPAHRAGSSSTDQDSSQTVPSSTTFPDFPYEMPRDLSHLDRPPTPGATLFPDKSPDPEPRAPTEEPMPKLKAQKFQSNPNPAHTQQQLVRPAPVPPVPKITIPKTPVPVPAAPIKLIPSPSPAPAPSPTAAPTKKSSLRDRQFDPDSHCGVPIGPDPSDPAGPICKRSLTCKTHSINLKRAVPGRSSSVDQLMAKNKKFREESRNAGAGAPGPGTSPKATVVKGKGTKKSTDGPGPPPSPPATPETPIIKKSVPSVGAGSKPPGSTITPAVPGVVVLSGPPAPVGAPLPEVRLCPISSPPTKGFVSVSLPPLSPVKKKKKKLKPPPPGPTTLPQNENQLLLVPRVKIENLNLPVALGTGTGTAPAPTPVVAVAPPQPLLCQPAPAPAPVPLKPQNETTKTTLPAPTNQLQSHLQIPSLPPIDLFKSKYSPIPLLIGATKISSQKIKPPFGVEAQNQNLQKENLKKQKESKKSSEPAPAPGPTNPKIIFRNLTKSKIKIQQKSTGGPATGTRDPSVVAALASARGKIPMAPLPQPHVKKTKGPGPGPRLGFTLLDFELDEPPGRGRLTLGNISLKPIGMELVPLSAVPVVPQRPGPPTATAPASPTKRPSQSQIILNPTGATGKRPRIQPPQLAPAVAPPLAPTSSSSSTSTSYHHVQPARNDLELSKLLPLI